MGHWAVFYELNISNPGEKSKVRHDPSSVNWNNLSSVFEVDVDKYYDVLIKKFPSQLLQSINQRIDFCNQLIPTKFVWSHWNPYWNAKLSGLALDLKKPTNIKSLNSIMFRLMKQSLLIMNWERGRKFGRKQRNLHQKDNILSEWHKLLKIFEAVKRFHQNSSSV